MSGTNVNTVLHDLQPNLLIKASTAALAAYTPLCTDFDGFSFGSRTTLSFFDEKQREITVDDTGGYAIADAAGSEIANTLRPDDVVTLVPFPGYRLPDTVLELGLIAFARANRSLVEAEVNFSELFLEFENGANGTIIEIGKNGFFVVYTMEDDVIDSSEMRALHHIPGDASDMTLQHTA